MHSSQPDGRAVAQDAIFLCPLNSYVDLPSPYTLQEVQVGVINTTMCNYLYSQPYFSHNIWGDMICAGFAQGGKDACFVSVPTHPNQAFWVLVSHQPSPRPESHGPHDNPRGLRPLPPFADAETWPLLGGRSRICTQSSQLHSPSCSPYLLC